MSLETIARVVAAGAQCAGLSVDIRTLQSLGMALRPEPREGKKVPVGDDVEDPWRDWLQDHRVELNAMDTHTFLRWRDHKFAPYTEKVIPPAEVLRAQLEGTVQEICRDELTALALKLADVEGQVKRAAQVVAPLLLDRLPGLEDEIADHLERHPADLWSAPLREIAGEICGEPCTADDEDPPDHAPAPTPTKSP